MLYPFLLGVAVAVAAKPVARGTYKGAAKLKLEAEKLVDETKKELAADELSSGNVDPQAIQAAIEAAVAKAVSNAMTTMQSSSASKPS